MQLQSTLIKDADNVIKNQLGEESLLTTNKIKNDNNNKVSQVEKYGLRPRTIIKRLQQERCRQEVCKKGSRSKCRPAPLSKYRRKTANARERHRMKEINNAFESLRKALPDVQETHESNAMTKISTLKLAVQYIQTLSQVLDETSDKEFYSLEMPSDVESSITRYGSCLKSVPERMDENNKKSPFLNSLHFTIDSSTTRRYSLSSVSDLDELLSDDSTHLGDNVDIFQDIQPLPSPDPFELLLEPSRENLLFFSDFSTVK